MRFWNCAVLLHQRCASEMSACQPVSLVAASTSNPSPSTPSVLPVFFDDGDLHEAPSYPLPQLIRRLQRDRVPHLMESESSVRP